ncbi:MAG: ChbG/HpnK family deacetylase [Halioglobus sp.]|nr:ChbG/HpnK family deacetylase [Halioglobus sp.]
MVNAPATEDAVGKAKQYPGLGVGLHFNITFGRPVSRPDKVRTLVDERGHFYSRGILARKMLLQRVSTEELVLELGAQFEQMKSFGLNPTHIDSHQHVHALPACFDTVAAFAASHCLPIRMPWILLPAGVQAPAARRVKQWTLKQLLARNSRHWNGRVNWNTGLGSIFDLGTVPDTPNVGHYRRLLEAAPAGVFELMVHPARNSEELRGLTTIGKISEQEWRFLMTGGLPTLMSELGFTKANYGDI